MKLLSFVYLLVLTVGYSPSKQRESTPYHYLLYSTIIKKSEDLMQYPYLFRVSDLYDIYPELLLTKCGREKCISPFIEMTNFENGGNYIKKLPTILVIGGMNGDKVIGTNAIYQLFDIIISKKNDHDEWLNILNNTRIIFLPMVNPTGFFYKEAYETQILEDFRTRVLNPNTDFNYDKDIGCFETFVGQAINHIFKDNLIIGMLNFNGAGNNILYPWGNYKHPDPKSFDQSAYHNVSQILKAAAGKNNNFGIPEYDTGTIKDLTFSKKGGLADWAYGASFEPQFISENCLPKNSLYTTEFLKVDDNSNRAFTLLIQAEDQNQPSEKTLGNALAVSNKKDSSAQLGHISRNIILMKQFFEVMRPFPIINLIKLQNVNKNQAFIKIQMDVKGCGTVDSVEVESPPVLSQSTHIDKPSYGVNTQSNSVLLKFKINPSTNDWNNITKIVLNIQCDSHWYQDNAQFGEPQSHFFRAKINQNYTAVKNGFFYNGANLNKVIIDNVRVKSINDSLIYHMRYNYIKMFNNFDFIIKMADKYPIQLSYDITSKNALMTKLDSTLDLNAEEGSDTEKTQMSEKDDNLAQILESIEFDDTNLVLSIYENNNIFPIYTDPKYVVDDIKVYYEKVSMYRKLKLSEETLNNASLDIQFYIGRIVSLTPTRYINLLGKRVIAELPTINDPSSASGIILWKNEVFDDSFNVINDLAKLDQELFELSDTLVNTDTEDDTQNSDPNYNKDGFSIPHSGISCGSNNPSSLARTVNDGYDFEIVIFDTSENVFDVEFKINKVEVNEYEFRYDNDKKANLHFKLIVDQTSTTYFTGTLEKNNDFIIGRKVQIVSVLDKDKIFECYMEKSKGRALETTKEVIKDINLKQIHYDPNGMFEQYAQEKSDNDDNTRLYVILGLFIGMTLMLGVCSICTKKIREAGRVTIEEHVPINQSSDSEFNSDTE